MPRRDGSGPMGAGAMTGRGMGACANGQDTHYGNGFRMGLSCRRGIKGGRGLGIGRGFFGGFSDVQISKEEQKRILENQKNEIQKRLEDLDK